MSPLPSRLPAFLWYLIRPRWGALVCMLLGLATGALINSALGPYFLKLVVDAADAVLNKYDASGAGMLMPAVGYAALFVAAALTYRSLDVVRRRMLPEVRRQVILDTSNWIQHHSPRTFADGFAGGFSNKVFDLADGATAIIARATWMFEGLAMLVLGTLTVWFIHAWLALVFLVWSILFIAVTAWALRSIYQRSQEYSTHRSSMVGALVDVFSNAASVRLFARHRHEASRLTDLVHVNVGHDRAVQQAVSRMRIGHDVTIIIFMAALLTVLIVLLRQGQASPGDFAMVLNLALATFQVIWTLADEAVFFAEEWGKCAHALLVATREHEITDAPDARVLHAHQGRMEFDDVSFGYQTGQPLFRHLRLRIEAGQKVGLVGASGSGKSSFINLLLRGHDPWSGRICIDGQDIAGVTQESLHSQIACVPQDPSLFHRSLLENIRYGRLEANDEEVLAAAALAHSDHFIASLPEGYQTMVGDRGIKLSGGQRQRVAIARAMLQDAPILVLDEATSALDSVTERCIQDALRHLMQGRTTIVVAHRLSTLASMDRILVFDQGRIVEDGSPAELLARAGHYARMWDMQAGGFLADAA